ncbi:C40 family peptidase [Caloramator sp. CAR-1]|uniref:C40 family peptidase n=1 Tax=Caloramator sp. CAR-1 TaxID=3062777 RepID=UPI0026E3DD5F|nr:C40 family peptidase [Caloramator sp. CAR-1]MDO6354237.1 C40 family peptidase [Caloramator sp. CAR-1]
MKRKRMFLPTILLLTVCLFNFKVNANINDARNNRQAISRGPQLVSYAKRFLGIRYKWSGQSPSGFDCSGFTSYVFKSFGIELPHSSYGQFTSGQKILKSQLLPGDLVFFQTSKRGISHVGIYIGNGKFIHASSGKGYVTITSLSEPYYSKRYRGAVRILR